MKKAPRKRKLEGKYRNYHFALPMELADKFDGEAKADDRSFASLFRRILEERYGTR